MAQRNFYLSNDLKVCFLYYLKLQVFNFFCTMILWYLKSVDKGNNDWENGEKDTELSVQKGIFRKILLLWFKVILQKSSIYQLWILITNCNASGYFCQSLLFLATSQSSELSSISKWVWSLETQHRISVSLLDFSYRNASSGHFCWKTRRKRKKKKDAWKDVL